jgi:hypothetical protein
VELQVCDVAVRGDVVGRKMAGLIGMMVLNQMALSGFSLPSENRAGAFINGITPLLLGTA